MTITMSMTMTIDDNDDDDYDDEDDNGEEDDDDEDDGEDDDDDNDDDDEAVEEGGVPIGLTLGGYIPTKTLWINTKRKEAEQIIGAKWTQLIPTASGRNKLSRKTWR